MYQLSLFSKDVRIILIPKVSTPMKYTVKDLRRDFPDEEACLEWLITWRFPNGVTCKKCQVVTEHRKVKDRRAYYCVKCGTQMSPTAGTICNNSHIPLTDWFYAIYQMSTNKAGTAAKQIERELGCSYHVAWRMMHLIRSMMSNPEGLLTGEVEIDESYVHPNVYKRSSAKRQYGRTGNRTGRILFGMVQRNGMAKVWHVKSAGARILKPLIQDNVAYGSLIHTDGYRAYDRLPQMGYEHRSTDHSAWQFYTPDSYTQNVENLWSTMKPRWKGTFKHVSSKYLQFYVDEFVWRYNYRHATSMFWALMGRLFAEETPAEGS